MQPEGSSFSPGETLNSIISWVSTHRRSFALWVGAGLIVALFVLGAFLSGWFFVSSTADRLVTAARSRSAMVGEMLAGANAASVTDPSGLDASGVPTKQASDPRYAFLLLGYGGGAHDGAYLTDSIMVVVVDPAQKALTLLSLPRDLWAPMTFNGQTSVYNKLNTGYAFAKYTNLYPDRLPRYKGNQGGGTLVMDTIARLLGIPVSYYLALDFEGFREMIDLVGGIDVNIPNSFSASYPANDNPDIDPSWTVVRFRKGLEHMGGERAIEYARARETLDNIDEGSDFARSRRQRLIMEAFKERLTQPSAIVRIPQLLAAGSSHVDTNYTIPSAAQLAQLAADWNSVRFYQAALTGENYLIPATGPQGMYILVPDAPNQSWGNIRAFARRLWDDPELGDAMAGTEIVVENDTGVSGLGSKVSTVLAKLGYRVGAPTTGTTRINSGLIDRTGGQVPRLVAQLETDLGLQLPLSSVPKGTSRTGIVFQLGSADVALANLVVPADPSAPSSAAGIVQAGSWAPEVPTVVPTPAGTPRVVGTPGTPSPQTTSAPRKVLPNGSLEPLPTAPRGSVTPQPTSGQAPGAVLPATPTPMGASATPTVQPARPRQGP